MQSHSYNSLIYVVCFVCSYIHLYTCIYAYYACVEADLWMYTFIHIYVEVRDQCQVLFFNYFPPYIRWSLSVKLNLTYKVLLTSSQLQISAVTTITKFSGTIYEAWFRNNHLLIYYYNFLCIIVYVGICMPHTYVDSRRPGNWTQTFWFGWYIIYLLFHHSGPIPSML